MLHTNGISIQSTGGYSSDLNGNVEIFNKTLKRRTGPLLANAGLNEIVWCYGAINYSNIHNYLSYSHNKSMTAYEAWYGKRPHWHNFRTFGCDVYVIDENKSKHTLKKVTKHVFLGWEASTSTIHYLDSATHEVKQARHVYFDDYSSSTPEKESSPGTRLLCFENPTQLQFDKNILNFDHNISVDPFYKNNIIEHTVELTPFPYFPFGIDITHDDFYGPPFIKLVQDIPAHGTKICPV